MASLYGDPLPPRPTDQPPHWPTPANGLLPAVAVSMLRAMPTLDALVKVADAGLHPWVRSLVQQEQRLAALREELEWAVTTAATEMDFARGFAAAQPQSGQPAEAFLNRWLTVTGDLDVLVGPRYRARDPQRPFVAVDAASRVVKSGDLSALVAVTRESFAPFRPGYVRLWSSDPVGSWPGTRSDMRNVAGQLGDLRRNGVPAELSVEIATGLDFYDRYAQIHRDHVVRETTHALHARLESRADLTELVDAGTLFHVLLSGRRAGLVAAEPGVQHGLRGAVVVELLLEPSVRGQGHGKHLSTLLAQHLEAPDDQFLLGTIHVDNAAAYRAAIASGRRDVGGEVVVPLN